MLAIPVLQAGTSYDKRIQEPANQSLGHPYIALFGGANVQQSADTVGIDGFESNNTGWFAGLKAGYEFETQAWANAAFEFEGFYSRADADFDIAPGVTTSGDIHAVALMANAYVKFKPMWHLRPYVGGGIGAAHLWLRDAEVNVPGVGKVGIPDDEGWTFAYQGIAGFDVRINEHWSVFAEYHALVFHDAIGLDNYLNHLVGGGVRFHF